MKWTLQNCLFAWQPDQATASFRNPFSGTTRITLTTDSLEKTGLEVVAGARATILAPPDRETGCCAYLWGKAVHPQHRGENLLRWCMESVVAGEFSGLSDLIGTFVLLIDDRRRRRVHLLADPMGVRPWFIGRHHGRIVSGSSVWPIHRAGLATSRIDFDSVASWFYYGYDCTGGSLFADYRRLTPGAVVTCTAGETTERMYARLTGANHSPAREQIADCIYEQVAQAFDLLTDDARELTVALSGGYDSRFIAALAARKKGLRCEAYTVRQGRRELAITSQIAGTIGLPLEVLHSDGSLWNMFSQPFHALPEGMPITKQSSHLVAGRRPGLPTLNGYLGDINIRGTGTRKDRLVEFQSDQTLVPSLTLRRRLSGLRFDLLEPGIEGRVEERARAAMVAMIQRGRAFEKPFLYTAYYGRQRFYTSNNILQHLDISEALLPFYRWSLIDLRFGNDYDCFWWETYELLFRRHFPALAAIPHADRIGSLIPQSSRLSHATRRWAATLLTHVIHPDCLPMLSRKKALPRLTGALLGRRDMEGPVLFLYRLFLLENRLRHSGMTLDWRAI